MDGVTVLNVIENPVYNFQWWAMPIILLILGIFFIAVIIALVIEMDDPSGIGLVGLTVVVFAVLIGLSGSCMPTDYYNTYEVTIEDTVSLKEFNEKYEIIDQHGQIYEVRERDNNNE